MSLHEITEEIDYLLFRIYEAHRDNSADAGAAWDLNLVCDEEDMWLVAHHHSPRVFIQSANIQTIRDALSGIVEYLAEVGK